MADENFPKERAYYTMLIDAKTADGKAESEGEAAVVVGGTPFKVGVLVKAEVKPDVLRQTLKTLFAEVPAEVSAMDVANAVKDAIGETKPYGVMVKMGDVTHFWVSARDYRYLIMAAFSGASA